MEFVQPFVWTAHAMLWYGALAAFFVGNAIMELTGIAQIRYSKFRRGKGISMLGTLIFDGRYRHQRLPSPAARQHPGAGVERVRHPLGRALQRHRLPALSGRVARVAEHLRS